MDYKGYGTRVEFDDESSVFHGEVVGTRDVITFEGTSVEALRRAFQDSVDDYLAWCAERGKVPDRPYSGRFVLRLDPEIHRAIDNRARAEGKSLNAWAAEALARVAKGRVA